VASGLLNQVDHLVAATAFEGFCPVNKENREALALYWELAVEKTCLKTGQASRKNGQWNGWIKPIAETLFNNTLQRGV
jgi:hypothetical protein